MTPTTLVDQPRYPVVDCHNHLGEHGCNWDKRPLSELLDQLDQAHVQTYVDLDGGWDEDILCDHLERFKAAAPERFCVFGGVDWEAWKDQGDHFGEWAASRLRIQAARGVQGLKIWKNLGLRVHDQHGALVAIDDARLIPLWEMAAELHLPVLIHVGDPLAFFDPLDATNERWRELHNHPEWHFPSPPYPPFESIINALANLVARHPQTIFIGAHVGCYAENLRWVGELLDRCPNFFVDISERIAELGRQPYSARRFCIQYADRILFGLDRGPDLSAYRIYYRFLETDDEYFDYDVFDPSRQGRWKIHGLFLPDYVLERIYYSNAERVILQLQRS
jgi:predicted TIM-barrel fold metal-dependent hydrolase